MRTNFSPTSAAARLHTAREAQAKSTPPFAPAAEARWCEWPRPAPVAPRRTGIWQMLQAIQARHA
jgi:hypothetical protein